MKIKIDQVIKNFDGTDIAEDIDSNKKVKVTFRAIIERTLHLHNDQNPLTAEKKQMAYQIGMKLLSKKLDEYDLTIDQIAFLKERIGNFYGPIIYGRFLELIGDEKIKVEDIPA